MTLGLRQWGGGYETIFFFENKKAIIESDTESRKDWMIWMMKRAGQKTKHNHGFQFWQQDNHPVQLETNEMMQQKLDYIHNNPVEAGFVDEPENYIYSSARDYSGIKGLIDISYLE